MALLVGPQYPQLGLLSTGKAIINQEAGRENLLKNTYKMTVEQLELESAWKWLYKQNYPWIKNLFKFLLQLDLNFWVIQIYVKLR